jgi:hypothetical protein
MSQFGRRPNAVAAESARETKSVWPLTRDDGWDVGSVAAYKISVVLHLNDVDDSVFVYSQAMRISL